MGQFVPQFRAWSAALLVACGGGGGDGSLAPPAGGGGGGGGGRRIADRHRAHRRSRPTWPRVTAWSIFPVGAAIETAAPPANADRDILLKHFSSITAENAMKPDTIWPNKAGTSGATACPRTQPNFAPGDTLAALRLQQRHAAARPHAAVAPDGARPGSSPATDRRPGELPHPRAAAPARLHLRRGPALPECVRLGRGQRSGQRYAESDQIRIAPTAPGTMAYSVGGGDRLVSTCATPSCSPRRRAVSIGRNSSNMKLMLNDYNTELPGKRANVLAIVQDVMNAGTVPHRRRRPPVPPAARRRCHAGHGGVRRPSRRCRPPWSTTSPSSTCLSTRIPGNCFSARTIPPCMADYGANPPATVLSQQATLYRALFTAFDRPSVTSDHHLGHRGQSHLAQYLAGDPHQPPAAVRYRRAIRSRHSGPWWIRHSSFRRRDQRGSHEDAVSEARPPPRWRWAAGGARRRRRHDHRDATISMRARPAAVIAVPFARHRRAGAGPAHVPRHRARSEGPRAARADH